MELSEVGVIRRSLKYKVINVTRGNIRTYVVIKHPHIFSNTTFVYYTEVLLTLSKKGSRMADCFVVVGGAAGDEVGFIKYVSVRQRKSRRKQYKAQTRRAGHVLRRVWSWPRDMRVTFVHAESPHPILYFIYFNHVGLLAPHPVLHFFLFS